MIQRVTHYMAQPTSQLHLCVFLSGSQHGVKDIKGNAIVTALRSSESNWRRQKAVKQHGSAMIAVSTGATETQREDI